MLTVVGKLFNQRMYYFLAVLIHAVGSILEASIFKFVDKEDVYDRIMFDVNRGTGVWTRATIGKIVAVGTHAFMKRMQLYFFEYGADGASMSLSQFQRFMNMFNLQISMCAEVAWAQEWELLLASVSHYLNLL